MAFIASKTLGILVLPSNLLFIALVTGLALLWLGKPKWGLRLATGATALLLFLGLFPVGRWLLEPLETRFLPAEAPPTQVDGIIVLGGAIDQHISTRWSRTSLNKSAERMTEAVALSRRYPKARIVFTGGIGSISQSGQTEAAIAVQFFHQQGIDSDRLVLEDKSRNTFENAVLTKRLVDPGEGERWLLITSASHMPRSVGCFRKAGWQVIPHPVDFQTAAHYWPEWSMRPADYIASADFAARAWIGLIAYYLMGRTSDLLPGPGP
ncbi:MAG: YdcF family protein [Sphingomonadales bacterium]